MSFGSRRLSTRLFLAFGALVALSLLSGGFALTQLGAVQASLETVVTDYNERIRLNQRMAVSVHVVSQGLRSILLTKDRAEMAEEAKRIVAARTTYDEARAALEKFPPSTEGRALRLEIDQLKTKSRAINDKVIELGTADRDAEAVSLLLRDGVPAMTQWQSAIDRNIALQEKHNRASFESVQSNYRQAKNLLIGVMLLGAVLAVVLSLLVVRKLVRELGGEPADVAALAKTIADSDLSAHVAVRPGDTTSVVAGMARMQASLAGVVTAVRANAESVATASAQIAHGNADLSSRTEEQAGALQQTAASMEELSSTVRQNADNARQASQFAHGASSVAIQGGEVVAEVVTTMKGINESSRRVVEIIGTIDGIAFQTNILALNAAVEAARAGAQGRGFAVVASEVRSLAQRSAEAARAIKQLITQSVQRVEEGTVLVDRAGSTMQEVVASIRRVTDIVGEISAASTEQATGVAQVGEAVTQMDSATQQNAALVEQSAAAAESLNAQARALVSAVAVFRLAGGTATTAAPHVRPATPSPRPVSSPVHRPAAAAAAAADRRGPNRAKNVVRPVFKARVPPEVLAERDQGVAGTQPTGTQPTGTDHNDWESF